MAKTKIEWATDVWNPITGCSPISEGCKNCYAKRMANRLRGRFGYPKDDPFKVTFHLDRLDQPLKWRKPRRIFVCSMGDLFHEDVPFEFIINIFGTMLKAKQHTYLLLTKRPQRAKEFMEVFLNICSELAYDKFPNSEAAQIVPIEFTKTAFAQNSIMMQTMSHVWLGVTVEHPDYQWRIDELLQIPAAVRFVSVEPMLSRVKLDLFRCTHGQIFHEKPTQNTCWCYDQGEYLTRWDCKIEGINWVIAGPETGPGARECKPEWIEDLYEQCKAAGVPFFDKRKNYLAREFPK